MSDHEEFDETVWAAVWRDFVADWRDGIAAERHAGMLVVATGAWSGAIAGLPELPVRPVRGQMLRMAGVIK